VLKELNGIGVSKKETRENSGIKAANGHPISPKFHSYKSLTNARRDFHNLGRFAKEIGIRNLSEINIEVVEQWIRSKDIVYHTASNYISEILKIQQHLDVTQAEIQELRKELKIDMPRKGEIAQSTRRTAYFPGALMPILSIGLTQSPPSATCGDRLYSSCYNMITIKNPYKLYRFI
jgi:hypothetical protein